MRRYTNKPDATNRAGSPLVTEIRRRSDVDRDWACTQGQEVRS